MGQTPLEAPHCVKHRPTTNRQARSIWGSFQALVLGVVQLNHDIQVVELGMACGEPSSMTRHPDWRPSLRALVVWCWCGRLTKSSSKASEYEVGVACWWQTRSCA